jgi:hypothetical protein
MANPGVSYTQGTPTPIPIANPGFEADLLDCSPSEFCYNVAVPGWLPNWFNGANSGTIKPGTAEYPSGVPGGVNVAFLGGPSAVGGIFQTLSAALQANTIYTLHMSIGHRADESFTGYVASLIAGGIAVASDNSLNPAPGTFSEETITYTTGATPILLGQLLSISVRSVGTGQVDVDNVSLTALSQ